MSDLHSYMEGKLRSIVSETKIGGDEKDKLRAYVQKCLDKLQKIPNLEKFTATLDELANMYEIVIDYKPNHFITGSQHLQNLKDLLEFSNYIFDNFQFCENNEHILALNALIHSCLQIAKDPVRSYTFFLIPPYTHDPCKFPCQYSFNYQYRDRILIPTIHLFHSNFKYILFSADDEVLIRENAIWFHHIYRGFNICTDLDSAQVAFEEKQNFIGFLNVFDCSTFLINNSYNKLSDVCCIYHSINERDIKYWDFTNLLSHLNKNARLKYIISLPRSLHEKFLPVKPLDVEQLPIVLTKLKMRLPDVFKDYVLNGSIGNRIVVFINSIDESFLTISKLMSSTDLPIMSPQICLELSNEEILENSEAICQSSGLQIIPLSSTRSSHFRLFNNNLTSNSIFVLFIVGDSEVPLYDVSFVIDACSNPNPLRRLSNVHGLYDVVVLNPKQKFNINERNEKIYNEMVQNYILHDVFNGFDIIQDDVDDKMVLDIFFFFLNSNFSCIFTNPNQPAIKELVDIDSDFITIIRCFCKVFESDQNSWFGKIQEYGLSLHCVCELYGILGQKGINAFLKLLENPDLHRCIRKLFESNLSQNIAKYNQQLDEAIFLDQAMKLRNRPGLDNNIFPSEFYFFGSECEIEFVHAVKPGMQALVDAPGCSYHPFFERLLNIYSGGNLVFKHFRDKLVVDPKDASLAKKAIEKVCTLMPFVGETLLVVDVVNDITIELVSLKDGFSNSVVKTSSLYFYRFDEAAMNYCLKNINRLKDHNKPLRISYINENIPICLVSNQKLDITSPVLNVPRNCSTEYKCNLKSLNELFKVKENVEDGVYECDVDTIEFIPPAGVIHPSLLSYQPALDHICYYLESHGIVSCSEDGHISMDYSNANKARDLLLDNDNPYMPPFAVLTLKPTASLSTVRSISGQVSPNWFVDTKRKLLIVPTEEKDTAASLLGEYISDEEPEIFFCVQMCEPPTKSNIPIVCYDLETGTSSSKPLCLGCFENFLHTDFETAKGNARYVTLPDAFTFDGYFPLGQVFYALRGEKQIFNLMKRWLQTVIIAIVHTCPGSFFVCPDHEDSVFSAAKVDNECPICRKRLCKECGQYHNYGQMCPRKLNEEIPDSDTMKKCPHCRIPVFKISGCNHITCRCGKHWCWKCKACFNNANDCYGHMNAAHGSFYQ